MSPDFKIVLYAGGAGSAGLGKAKEITTPNFLGGSGGLFYGTTDDLRNTSIIGSFATGYAGGIRGGTIGAGALVGINFGNVEDLSGRGSQAGVVFFGATVSGTFNEENKLTGLEVGFGGKGFGVGVFGTQTQTTTFGSNGDINTK